MSRLIENAALQVVQVLGKSLSSPGSGMAPQLLSDLDTVLVRLNIWAGNMGVFAKGAASLDERLDDRDDVSDVLCHHPVSHCGFLGRSTTVPEPREICGSLRDHPNSRE
ncbi:hypothetical protein B0H67DRAFT_639313 [Lasiosphaeris hirsuta]|uniref:Uncharacterized protein n=1 Tax=Lasiosphaeris hirsuta TaxID=260670 RepID=A0AA40E792_9PEZI|nr:hypothetical protein B0H67DRAFT_639313 [Lasiosphaeris hirsuta]